MAASAGWFADRRGGRRAEFARPTPSWLDAMERRTAGQHRPVQVGPPVGDVAPPRGAERRQHGVGHDVGGIVGPHQRGGVPDQLTGMTSIGLDVVRLHRGHHLLLTPLPTVPGDSPTQPAVRDETSGAVASTNLSPLTAVVVGSLVTMVTTACAFVRPSGPERGAVLPVVRAAGRVGPSTAAEERRVVTVLFADIVGYTSLAEHLDPEKVKRLVESCFARLVADIEELRRRRRQGPRRRHRRPLRRARSPTRTTPSGPCVPGCRCRPPSASSPPSVASSTAAAAPIEMRVGINTGEVLVGSMSGSDYTAMGDVVNTAARLQALAPPGGVLVGERHRGALLVGDHLSTVRRHRHPRPRAERTAVARSPAPPRPDPGRCAPTCLRRSRQRAHTAGVGDRPRSPRPRRRGVDRRRGGLRQDPTDLRDHRSL